MSSRDSVADQRCDARGGLIEVFKTEVGLTPKLFYRVQRFQRILALMRRVSAPSWSRLALDCGFFDQSHLIRDFVEFSGLAQLSSTDIYMSSSGAAYISSATTFR
jgi:AraC-like DNA-binding protein